MSAPASSSPPVRSKNTAVKRAYVRECITHSEVAAAKKMARRQARLVHEFEKERKARIDAADAERARKISAGKFAQTPDGTQVTQVRVVVVPTHAEEEAEHTFVIERASSTSVKISMDGKRARLVSSPKFAFEGVYAILDTDVTDPRIHGYEWSYQPFHDLIEFGGEPGPIEILEEIMHRLCTGGTLLTQYFMNRCGVAEKKDEDDLPTELFLDDVHEAMREAHAEDE